MTARPIDTIQEDIDCAAEYCYGMLGGVTLFFGGDERLRRRIQSDDEQEAEQVWQALEKAMTDGIFDSNPPIVRVAYVSGVRDDGELTRSTESENDKFNVKLAVPLIVGAVVIALILFFWLRNREYRDMAMLDQQDTPNVDPTSRVAELPSKPITDQSHPVVESDSSRNEDDSSNEDDSNNEDAAVSVRTPGDDSRDIVSVPNEDERRTMFSKSELPLY